MPDVPHAELAQPGEATRGYEPTYRPVGRLRRVVLSVALTGLLGTGLVVGPTGTAHAVWCNNNTPNLGTYAEISHDSGQDKDYLFVFDVQSVVPTFDIGASSVVGNDSESSVTRTASVGSTQTFTITTTLTVSQSTTLNFAKLASATYGYSFAQSETTTRTTTSATSDVITLQPHSALRADRGLEAANITYNLRTYLFSNNNCIYQPALSANNVVTNVPTTVERWDWKNYPTINPGGVVWANSTGPANYYDIHPGTIVSLYGNGFEAADIVIVRQGARTWTIGSGSPYWYESGNQINATLPADLPPNSTVLISVRSRNGQATSLESLWPRSVNILG